MSTVLAGLYHHSPMRRATSLISRVALLRRLDTPANSKWTEWSFAVENINNSSLFALRPGLNGVKNLHSCLRSSLATEIVDACKGPEARWIRRHGDGLYRCRILRLSSAASESTVVKSGKTNSEESTTDPLTERATSIADASTTTPAMSKATKEQISLAFNHEALIVTRNIEWGTVLLGFEQANKYTVMDEEGETVALIAEDITGIGNAVGRQLLRTRRSFTATVLNADGSQVIFRIRRPMYLITSSMYIETGDGEILGEIQQRWHLWKRNYDLYMEKTQFARIEGNFLAWEFELKNEKGGTLALIDRNFQGFGKEIFTDAGKYVIHFGESPTEAATSATKTLRARLKNPTLPAVTPMAKARTGVKVIPTAAGSQLVVAKRLDLTQRMVALACAMTIDFDYFSRHSSGAGYLTPPIFMPIPTPGGSDAPEGDVTGQSAAADPSSGSSSLGGQYGEGDEGFLGDDEAWSPDQSEMLDGGEGGGLSGLIGNISDIFNDS